MKTLEYIFFLFSWPNSKEILQFPNEIFIWEKNFVLILQNKIIFLIFLFTLFVNEV